MSRRTFASIDPGRYIAVYGTPGSGKTTFSRELGAKLGLPVFELDAVYHGPGWRDLDDETFRARVRELLDRNPHGWVFDGNYGPVRDLILERATTAIWLRLPFRTVYPRLVRRTLRRMFTREELWNGNREEPRMIVSRDSILLWGITDWRPNRRRVRAALRGASPRVRVVVLRDPGEVRKWIHAVPAPGDVLAGRARRA